MTFCIVALGEIRIDKNGGFAINERTDVGMGGHLHAHPLLIDPLFLLCLTRPERADPEHSTMTFIF